MNKLKKQVCKNLTHLKGLFEKAFDTTNTSSNKLPTFHEKKDTLYRARKTFLNAEKLIFHTVKDVSVPESLAQNFLIAQDGEDDKILVFVSKLSRKVMKGSSSHCYYGDGTFKSVPKPFYQLYTLHIDLHSDMNTTSIVPVCLIKVKILAYLNCSHECDESRVSASKSEWLLLSLPKSCLEEG